MIPNMDGRQRAARAVAARRGELGMTQQDLASAAGVDSKTIYNLESRGRWPIARTRARIEKALGWPVGEMGRIAESDEEPEPEDILPGSLRQSIQDEYKDRPDIAAAVIEAVEATLSGRPLPPTRRRASAR